MNRARIYILAAVTIILASVLLPTRATAAHRGSDATNLRHIHHALVEGGATALGEGRASQVMSQVLADIPGKEVVILAITYPPGTFWRGSQAQRACVCLRSGRLCGHGSKRWYSRHTDAWANIL